MEQAPGSCRRMRGIVFHAPFVVHPDELHLEDDPRFYALGCKARFRLLLLVFTIRKNPIRVFSACDMTRREKAVFGAI